MQYFSSIRFLLILPNNTNRTSFFTVSTATSKSLSSLNQKSTLIKSTNFNLTSASAVFTSGFNQSIEEQGCDPTNNFSLIAHGWIESFKTPWVQYMITKLLQHRGGCVFFMDYSKYANVSDYFQLTPHFDGIAAVMLKKVQQIGNYDRQFLFGFSFGSRLCIDVGNKVGNQSISRMDLCDPAG